MIERRVVITGVGVVTPLGDTLKTFWENIKNGVSGIDRITAFDATEFDCRIAGEVKNFVPAPFFNNPKDCRRSDRFTQMGMAASKRAFADAGIDMAKVDADRFGVVIGSGIGGLKTLEDQHTILMNKGPSRVSPFMIPMMISNMASGLVSIEFGWQGPNFAPVSACSTSCHAIGEAWRMIRDGDAEVF